MLLKPPATSLMRGRRVGRHAEITPAEHSTRHQITALARVPAVWLVCVGCEGTEEPTGGIGGLEVEDCDEAVDAGEDYEAAEREDEQ